MIYSGRWVGCYIVVYGNRPSIARPSYLSACYELEHPPFLHYTLNLNNKTNLCEFRIFNPSCNIIFVDAEQTLKSNCPPLNAKIVCFLQIFMWICDILQLCCKCGTAVAVSSGSFNQSSSDWGYIE